MFRLSTTKILTGPQALTTLPEGKLLINTINAHSYNMACRDALFAKALRGGDMLLPDGIGIVKALRWLTGERIERVAGADLFAHEMQRLAQMGGTCFFLGSSPRTLELIRVRAAKEYPAIRVESYSPPYKAEFSDADNAAMIAAVNVVHPDLLWIGMTAPKQEKWAYAHRDALQVRGPIGTIGAVFDFYAGTVTRAPQRWQALGLEWLYRLLKEPRRMWRRYLIGNPLFVINILKEKIWLKKH